MATPLRWAIRATGAVAALFSLLGPAHAGPGSVPFHGLSEKPTTERIPLLKALLAERESAPEAADLALLLGRAYLDDGRPADAGTVLRRNGLENHPLKEWAVRWRLEAIPAATATRGEREPLLEALFTAPGEASFRIDAAKELAEMRVAANRWTEAIAPLEALLRDNPLDVATAARLATACARSGDESRAQELALWLHTEMPAKEETRAFFKEDATRLKWVADLTPERRLRRFLRLDAAGALSDLAFEYPKGAPSSEEEALWAPYLSARIQSRQEPPGTTLKRLLALSSPPEVRQAALRQAQGILTQGGLAKADFEKGVRALDEGLALAEERERAFLALHRMRLKEADASGAAYFALKTLQPDTESFIAPEYLYRSAWESQLAGKTTVAKGLWEDLAQSLSPANEYRQASLFTLLLLGHLPEPKDAEARKELLQTSKYGYFGYELRQGAQPATLAASTLDLSPPSPPPAPPGSHRDKASHLRRLALYDEAASELSLTLPEKPLPWQHWELAKLWAEAKRFPNAVTSARKALPGAYSEKGDFLSPEAWQMLYPLPYPDALRKASEVTGLPADLLAAVARQESLWDKAAVSRAGAVGLMQLLPSTANEVARKAGLPLPSAARLRDPDWNLPAGARYLQRMLARCGNSVPIALASYNAGPGNADKWRARPNNPADPRLFTESVPFRETRLYIRRITLYRQEYRRIYPERFQSPPAP